jgi:hypothetical protein
LQTAFKCLFFICLLGIVLSIASGVIDFGVRNSNDAQVGKVNLILDKVVDPEIAIFGSSVGEVGVSSRVLSSRTGKSVYNFSIDGTPYIQYRGLVDYYNDYSQHTGVVVFMESYFSLQRIPGISGAERYLAHISNPYVYSSLRYIQPDLAWKCRNIPLYKYVAATSVYYKNALRGYQRIISKKEPLDTLLGQSAVNRSWETDQDQVLSHTPPFQIRIDNDVTALYVKTLEHLARKHRKVVIVLAPVYSVMSHKLTDYTALRRTFLSLAHKSNAVFLDFTTDSLCSNKQFFYNTNHLNVDGSKVFSEKLADSLKQIITSG